MPNVPGILFIQSQEGFGADSMVHTHLMRHLDRSRFGVHVACTKGHESTFPDSLSRLAQIPDVHLRLTEFVPGIRERDLNTLISGIPHLASAPLDVLRLRNYIARHSIKLIHSSDRPRDSLYSVLLGKLTGAKSVVHVHVKWSNEYSAPARWSVNNADAVFSISEYVTRSIVDMGRPSASIHTILNCIDVATWDPTTDGSEVRRSLSIPDNAVVLASVSRLFAWKGQRELLKAFAEVRRQRADCYLLIVGADAPHEGGRSFTLELQELARELGVHEFVRFTGPRQDIPRVMAACDVFSMPSFEEPFGLVFLEAMAMERPVVALNNGGTPEVVAHGETGLLSPPWDIPALAENILSLAGDPERRRQMGKHGRERVLAHFTAERMATQAADAYTAILSHS